MTNKLESDDRNFTNSTSENPLGPWNNNDLSPKYIEDSNIDISITKRNTNE